MSSSSADSVKHALYPMTMKFLEHMKRGDSIMGSKQGDHATAYALIKLQVDTILSGEDPVANFYRMVGLMEEITDMQNLYKIHYEADISEPDMVRLKRQEQDFEDRLIRHFSVVQKNKAATVDVDKLLNKVNGPPLEMGIIRETMMRNNWRNVDESMTELAQAYLLMRNRLFLAAFRKTKSSPGSEEGHQVKNAKNTLIELNDNIQGAKIGEIIENINDTFYYPRLPVKELTTKKAVGYRTNEIGTLVAVASEHLAIIFNLFPNFKQFEEKIRNQFNENIMKNWKMKRR